MFRKRSRAHDDPDSQHGDRPWVFFMVDCFFLITEFFVLTFQFKVSEAALPQKMPPGCYRPGDGTHPDILRQSLTVSVDAASGVPAYEVLGTKLPLREFSARLAAVVEGKPERYLVRVSYTGGTVWGDVLAVFDTCAKVKISQCGLIPLRGTEANRRALR